MFDSLKQPDPQRDKLDDPLVGSLFHTIEYTISDIINKINNVNDLSDSEIKNIIIRQHDIILNYDLFLINKETRSQVLKLFTNKKFLKNLMEVIRQLSLTRHEIVCLNKLAYDYYLLPNKDQEISDYLYKSCTEVNGKQVIVLSGIYGLHNAEMLTIIRNSTFKEEKAVHRVNTFILKCNLELSVDQIVSTYCYLFERFTRVFIYTMLESRPSGLSTEGYKKFDNISIALLAMLDSLPKHDMNKVLLDYGYTLMNIRYKYQPRFSLKTATSYPRIVQEIENIEVGYDDIIIP